MNHPVEHKDLRAIYDFKTGLLMTVDANSKLAPVPINDSIITVCAWCDKDKVMTKLLTQRGYFVSHGMCERCSQQQEQQMKGQTK